MPHPKQHSKFKLELESGIVKKRGIVSTGGPTLQVLRGPGRYERLSQIVLAMLGLIGPSTAYSLARGCGTHLSSTKQTLLRLKRKGLVRVTARYRVQSAKTGTRKTLSEAWGLTQLGLDVALHLVQDQDWAVERMVRNFPLQALGPRLVRDGTRKVG